MIYELFPKELLALDREMREQGHEKLQSYMQTVMVASGGQMDASETIAAVAAYCSIVVDAYYSEADLLHLCTILVRELKKIRGASAVWTTGVDSGEVKPRIIIPQGGEGGSNVH